MTMTRGGSMRGRLLAFVIAASAIAWLASSVALMRAARQEGARLHDEHLEDVARLLLQVAAAEPAGLPAGSPRAQPIAPPDEHTLYQIWSAGGLLLRASQTAPREPFAPLTETGHVLRSIGGTEHRVFSSWGDARAVQVQVAERDDLRGFVFGRVAPSLLLLFVATTAVLVVFSAYMARRWTRVLDHAAVQLNQRVAGDTRPLATADAPKELRPLLDAADALSRRYAAALESERRFSAAAAHELRTPLAAVRVQAQVAERARTPADAREALVQLQVCVERASRTIDQLLTLAQFEAARVAPETATTVELAALAARVIHDMNPLLRSRGIELTMSLEPVAVQGLEQGLAALVRNLVDNAARHSPPNSKVRVRSGATSEEGFVAVEDSGPGIPADERDRVFERFYRLPTQNADGVGVGLSIVETVARAHGGRIVLSDSDLGGLHAAFFLSRQLERRSAADQLGTAADTAAQIRTAARAGEVGNHPPPPRG